MENNNMIDQISIGWGSASLTPDRPIFMCGQLYERVTSYVHDPIAVTALAISLGSEHAVLVSADMPGIYPDLIELVSRTVAGRLGGDAPDPDKIVYCATHTHNSASFSANDYMDKTVSFVGRQNMP
jgi:hypothetical protein